MPQADSSAPGHLRTSLDQTPSGRGQVTALTALPTGWGYFCSRPDDNNPARWYAVPPWNVYRLQMRYGKEAARLLPTVDAETWPRLHAAVNAQARMHAEITGEVAL